MISVCLFVCVVGRHGLKGLPFKNIKKTVVVACLFLLIDFVFPKLATEHFFQTECQIFSNSREQSPKSLLNIHGIVINFTIGSVQALHLYVGEGRESDRKY